MFSQWGRWGKTSVQTFSNRFLKTVTEGAVATEAGSLFQYFTTLTENADPLLRRWLAPYLLVLTTCVGIHPGRVEPASPIALTSSRTEAFQARRSCASSLGTFTQSFLHLACPKTRGPEIGSRSALVVVAHVFSWPPVRLRHMRGGVGRRRSLISSPSGRLAA